MAYYLERFVTVITTIRCFTARHQRLPLSLSSLDASAGTSSAAFDYQG